MAQTPADLQPQPQPQQQEDVGKEPGMEELTNTSLHRQCDIDLNKHKLPFEASLFKGALKHPTQCAKNTLLKYVS